MNPFDSDGSQNEAEVLSLAARIAPGTSPDATGPAFGLPEGEYEWKLGHHPNEHPALDTDTLMEALAAARRCADVLAAALAETGDFPGAAAAFDHLMSDPSRVRTDASTDRLKEQFDAYQKRELLRE
jgi:hypothetical protein